MAEMAYQKRNAPSTREAVSQQRGGRVLEDNRAAYKQLKQKPSGEPLQRVKEEEELLQKKSAQPNRTGLPDNLKTGIESLSGLSMDPVKVHYNSAQPAQLNALAYTQGTDIHVAPGQEKHLPHEAWHVVQQAQGRVKPTMQMKDGVPVNDDAGLEREADVMGAIAKKEPAISGSVDSLSVDGANSQSNEIIQKQRNKRRWTPQQRTQSEKFWEKKHAREKSRQQSLNAYKVGLEEYGIVIDHEQARVLNEHGFSRSKLKEFKKMEVNMEKIVGLCKSGFSRWAIENLNIVHLKQWNGSVAPENLINEILMLCSVDAWIEANHHNDREKGDERVNINKNIIKEKLKVDISKQSGGAFQLSPNDYKSACAFLSVRQALQNHEDLDYDIRELVEHRNTKSQSEHAIQDGNQIFFKEEPIDSTVVHELVHFYGAQDEFIQNFCFGQADGINEGFTEFFARKAKKADKNRMRTVYPKQVAAVEFMAKEIGEDVLRNAYFTGNVDSLKQLYKEKIGADWTAEEEVRITAYPRLKE